MLRYELRYRFRFVSTYVYFIIFMALSFLIMNGMGGAFDGVEVSAGRSGEHNLVNSPLVIMMIMTVMMFLGTIIIAAIFGNSAVRDFETGSHSIFFTKPMNKVDYVLGRYCGSFITVLFILAGAVLGLYIGTLMPYLQANKIGPNHLITYVQPFMWMIIPNLIFTGMIFFGVGLLSRKIITSYIAAIILFIGYMLASMLMGDVDNLQIAAMCDPWGLIAIFSISRYWSTLESNTRLIPFWSILLANRTLWMGLGILGLLLMVKRFRFAWQQDSSKTEKKKKSRKAISEMPISVDPEYMQQIKYRYFSSFKQICHFARYEFFNIVRNLNFYVIMAIYLLFLIITATQMVGNLFGTQTHPVTTQVLDALTGNLLLFGMIVSTFYAGELIWRERVMKMDQLFDVTPHKNAVGYLSKVIAVLMMQLVFLALIIIVGLITQIANGYYRFELGLYLFELLVINYPSLINVTLVTFFFAAVIDNKYAGYLAMVIFYVFFMFGSSWGIDHNLLSFNGLMSASYSDMNGYGNFLPRFFSFKLYWFLFSAILTFVAIKFWARGMENSFRQKCSQIFAKGYDAHWRLATGFGIAFVLLAAFIFYNTNILNDYYSNRKQEKMQVQYENQYRYLNDIKQPRISEVNLNVELYPKLRFMKSSGYYWLVNRSDHPIDTLIVNYDTDIDIHKIDMRVKSKLLQDDKKFGVRIYRLEQALAVQDSLRFNFEISVRQKGFPNSGMNYKLAANGTFFNSSYYPSFGYSDAMEVSDSNKRKKHKLPPKPRMASIDDMEERCNTYISSDSDWIRYEAVVSTDADQLAFTSGHLEKEWQSKGRNFRFFKSDTPILNFFTFVSGKYEVAKANWQDIQIEVYYDKKHPYNVDAMLKSAQSSLKYYSENYMPYPHKELRIVEVPYVGFAQSLPTLIPFSENIGFIAKVDPDNPQDVDYPYYVTAHEIAHQWWAHILIGANVQGATMLSEAFAEYSALMVMKEKYGKDRMRRFLSYLNDSYLSGRAGETKVEQPLYLVENQQYIHYNKGSLVMYALQDYIGEEAVNKALSAFCKDHAFQKPPYPVSTDFLPYLRAVVPAQKQYLVEDMFETITLYDNRIESVKSSYDAKEKSYITTVKIKTGKARYDGLGAETKIATMDMLDIALYEKKNETPLAFTTIQIADEDIEIQLKSKKKPQEAVLDPFYKLLDKKPDDNKRDITL